MAKERARATNNAASTGKGESSKAKVSKQIAEETNAEATSSTPKKQTLDVSNNRRRR